MIHILRASRLVAGVLALCLLATPTSAVDLRRPVVVEKDGVRFGMIRPTRGQRAAPTLIFLATSIDDTFNATFGGLPERLHNAGWLIVTLDLPAHGRDRRVNEGPAPRNGPSQDAALLAWRHRIARGEPIVAKFVRSVSSTITLLVRSGDADPKRIFIGGISRGGFMALHAAAADRRLVGVVCLIPVTELSALTEFKGAIGTHALDASRAAPTLAGRPIWITIGANDDRVSTAATLRFAQSLSAAAARNGVPNRLELHVREAIDHSYPPDAESQAAAWLLKLASSIR